MSTIVIIECISWLIKVTENNDDANKMQRYTIFFITVSALHVSGSFSTHHPELKNCMYSIWYMSSLLAATASGAQLPNTDHAHN